MTPSLRKIPQDLKNRYAFDGNTDRLYKRVVDYVAPNSPILDKMISGKFLSAGNTLVAGAQPLAPNCAIIGEITDQNCDTKLDLFIKLLSNAIGVGIDLSRLSDPVGTLHDFAKEASNISLGWDRPLRGNMATLSIEHPRIREFIACKRNRNHASELSMFNISVSITDRFMDQMHETVNSASIFQMLCDAGHRSGDPGVLFIDKAQFSDYNGIPGERIVCCVPCGEQFMYSGETCTLGAINLDAFYNEEIGRFDTESYTETIREAVQFLDAVIDKLVIPDEWMAERTRSLRRIGLGVMGLANLLERSGIPYESEDALTLSSLLARHLTQTAIRESERLGSLYGTHPYSETRRNITVTCLQPTGGIRRLIADDGFSIEPFFKEATSVSPTYAVQMTATWQNHIENAVSKTVNLPRHAKVSDIANVYHTAYRAGCKGITVYRDGSKEHQPLSLKQCKDGDSCSVVMARE